MNLYCVSSPLQLLTAIEASELMPAKSHVLVIRAVNGSRTQHTQQMEKLLSIRPWDEVVHWPNFKENSLLGRVQAAHFIRSLARRYRGQCNNFMFGGFGWVKNHSLRSLLKPKNVYILDDGTATLHQHKEFFLKGLKVSVKVSRLYSDRGIRSRLTNLTYPIDRNIAKQNINIFTSFDIHGDEEAGVRVIKHEFEAIRRRSPKKVYLETSVFYFGSPLSEKGLIGISEEIDQIVSIDRYYSQKQVKLTYVAHRDDSEEKIKELERRGIKHSNLEMPAELYFAVQSELPLHVASSSSTALHNVATICRDTRPLLFSISAHIQKPDRKASMESIEHHYQAIGIPVLESHVESWRVRSAGLNVARSTSS